ncbi:MAG: segregation/condensation protein A [Candidatus Campbellbacteria bacterium]|nr:segregation/condensation protein A [Candidatus Campbellbacteria bacterium]
MSDNAFVISTGAFEGPLPLLLELVQKRKVFISDIALADITEEFLSVIREQERSLKEDADFISVATTLLLIKSKSLLPNFELTPEEEESTESLTRRLEAFEKIRIKSNQLAGIYGKNVFLRRRVPQSSQKHFIPDDNIAPRTLEEAIKNVRDHLPQKNLPERVTMEQTVRLEDVLESLSSRIKKHIALSFREFASIGRSSRRDVVVHFVALLELVKQGFLEAEQTSSNGDIKLKHQEVRVPNYS